MALFWYVCLLRLAISTRVYLAYVIFPLILGSVFQRLLGYPLPAKSCGKQVSVILNTVLLMPVVISLCYSPMWARGQCRISPPCFLAECCKRQLNQVSLVLLYFRLSTFSDLYWVCLSIFSCTVLFVSISQVIGCEDRLRNDLYCVEWGVKLYSNQLCYSSVFISVWASTWPLVRACLTF